MASALTTTTGGPTPPSAATSTGSKNLTVYELYARIVREQMDEDLVNGDVPDMYQLDAKVRDEMKLEEDLEIMVEWLTSLDIPRPDAALYCERLRERGVSSLQLLSQFNPEDMKQVFTKDGHIQTIQGNIHKLRLLEHVPFMLKFNNISWEWDDETETPNPHWVAFPPDASRRLEIAFKCGQSVTHITCGHNQTYQMDLRAMTQTNTRTGHTRTIRRAAQAFEGGPESVPWSMLCPIGCDLMLDPVLAADGHSYDRKNIERWLADHSTSPKTGLRLPNKQLVPNHALRNAIEELFPERFKDIVDSA